MYNQILTSPITERIWLNKYRHKQETFDEWLDRVSNHDCHIKKLIEEKKFIFGGRILANRNTNNGSLSNCYSHGYIEDSLKEIMNANTNLALTFKAQGGQGISLSKIRPKGTKVGTDFISDGILPFMEMFNTTTQTITQGAGRRGALLISLDVNHKEAEEFISIKSNLNKINNANLSLEIDDEFMQAVDEYYNTGNVVYKNITRFYNSETIHYTICPIKIFKKLAEHAWKYAEPGVIFTNRFRNYNLMEYDINYQIETGNPCGRNVCRSKIA